MRRRKRFDALDDVGERLTSPSWTRRRGRQGERRGRPPAPDLHVLPSGARRRRAGRADASRSLRLDDGRNRAGVSDAGAHAGAADRARQEQDPRRAHPIPGPDRARSSRTARRRAARHLSRLQRGLHRLVRRGADAPRRVSRRGHSPGTAARGPPARARSDWPAGADAAARITARARTSADGEIVLLEDQDRVAVGSPAQSPKGRGSVERALVVAAVRPLRALQAAIVGGARRSAEHGRDGLERDRRPVRRVDAACARRRSSS